MLSLLLLLGLSRAQAAEVDGTVDIEALRPHPDAHGYFGLPSASTLGHLQLMGGLWLHLQDDPLVLSRGGERLRLSPGEGESGDALIDRRLSGEAQLGFGAFGWASVGVGLPVVLVQDGVHPGGLAAGQTPALTGGPGDLHISPRLSPLRAGVQGPLGVGLSLPLRVPTGRAEALATEGGPTFTPALTVEVADGDVGRGRSTVRAAAHLGWRLRPDDRLHDVVFNDVIELGLAGGWRPDEQVELLIEALSLRGGGGPATAATELRAGLRWQPTEAVSLRVGGGAGLGEGVGAPDWRALLGLTVAPLFDPNARDLDRDGLTDARDRCPSDPEDFDHFRDADGCPDPDNDRDGLLDAADRCPDDPEDEDGFEDDDGCPDSDNDRDSVPDPEDRCPLQPESLNGHLDDDGCPDDVPAGDSDGDGYLDDVDRCPLDAEDLDGFDDLDGCPELDNDQDGIPDARDRCPMAPEAFNGVSDEDGCPDEATRVQIDDQALTFDEPIYFDLGKATIQERSLPLLDEIAALIVAHPELRLIRVEGHTDSEGADMVNLRLSQARAEAVRKHLIAKGVQPSRLDARGFGEMYPIAPNDLPSGRAQNRRVEFVIVEGGR